MTAVTKSREGLKYIAWSLLLYLISLAILLVIWITLIVAFTTAFRLMIAILAPFAFLSLATFILFIKGFFALYSHRRGLGPRHEKNMQRSLLLCIGIVVAIITLNIAVFVLRFLVVFPSAMVVQQGLGVFVTFLIGLLLYFMVAALITTELQPRLKLAAVLLVLSPVAGFVTFMVSYLTDGFLVSAFGGGNLFFPRLSIQYPDVLGSLFSYSLAIAATFLFWRSYQASREAV